MAGTFSPTLFEEREKRRSKTQGNRTASEAKRQQMMRYTRGTCVFASVKKNAADVQKIHERHGHHRRYALKKNTRCPGILIWNRRSTVETPVFVSKTTYKFHKYDW